MNGLRCRRSKFAMFREGSNSSVSSRHREAERWIGGFPIVQTMDLLSSPRLAQGLPSEVGFILEEQPDTFIAVESLLQDMLNVGATHGRMLPRVST